VLQNLVPDQNTPGCWAWRCNLPALVRTVLLLETFDYEALVRQWGPYEGPTLFLGGSLSDYILPTALKTITKYFPAAEVQMISNAGHWIHAAQPEAFVAAVDRFLLAHEDK